MGGDRREDGFTHLAAEILLAVTGNLSWEHGLDAFRVTSDLLLHLEGMQEAGGQIQSKPLYADPNIYQVAGVQTGLLVGPVAADDLPDPGLARGESVPAEGDRVPAGVRILGDLKSLYQSADQRIRHQGQMSCLAGGLEWESAACLRIGHQIPSIPRKLLICTGNG